MNGWFKVVGIELATAISKITSADDDTERWFNTKKAKTANNALKKLLFSPHQEDIDFKSIALTLHCFDEDSLRNAIQYRLQRYDDYNDNTKDYNDELSAAMIAMVYGNKDSDEEDDFTL